MKRSVYVFVFLLMFGCGAPVTTQAPETPTAGAQIEFSSDKESLQLGECAALVWSVRGGFGVTLDAQPVDKSGRKEVCPVETRSYILAVDVGTHVEEREILIVVQGVGPQPPSASATVVSSSPWIFDPATLRLFTSGEPYQGYETGLYPGGSNTIPEAHLEAGIRIAGEIRPLNPEGEADESNGRILALVLGHSNTHAYFSALQSHFVEHAAELHPRFELLNAAMGGEQLPQIAALEGGVWNRADELTSQPGYSRLQVQALFLHTTYHGCCNDTGMPPEAFHDSMVAMQSDLAKVLRHAIQVYSNLKIAYLTSDGFRYYRNFEPHVWREAFAFKWLIETQINGAPDMAFSGTNPRMPWLQWGPYIWDNAWDESYFTDGVHPSEKALEIVVDKYWTFLLSDEVARVWLFR
ncbi:MAG: hypothetical protein AB1750_01620 [Chloroflexota bacterium]